MNRLPPPFVAVKMELESWDKVSHNLPIPSVLNHITSSDGRRSVAVAWRIKHTISTPKQWRWVAAVKLGIKSTLFVEFDFIDEIFVNTSSECNAAIYTLQELDRAFNAGKIDYPKYLQPSSTKELYQSMLFFAARLHYEHILTLEGVIAAGLDMAAKLADIPSDREVIKKAKEAIKYIKDHPEKYKQRMSEEKRKIVLSKAGKRGGSVTGNMKRQQGERTRKRVLELLESGKYQKANGKPDVTALAKEAGISRRMAYYIIKTLVAIWFLFWMHLWNHPLLIDRGAELPFLLTLTNPLYLVYSRSSAACAIRQSGDTTLKTKALLHKIRNAHFTGFERCWNFQKRPILLTKALLHTLKPQILGFS